VSPKIAVIQAAVGARWRVSVADLQSRRQSRAVVCPRHVAMWLARHLTPASLPEIGRAFGDRDHTTVMHALARIDQRMAESPLFEGVVLDLAEQLSPIAGAEQRAIRRAA
jgi:chromosomal replication initiator protein